MPGAPQPQSLPLQPKDLRELNKSLADLAQNTLDIDQAEKAGLDVAEQRARNAHLRDVILRIKATYFGSTAAQPSD